MKTKMLKIAAVISFFFSYAGFGETLISVNENNDIVYELMLSQSEEISLEDEGITLKWIGVRDSRCPDGKLCFWEGEVELNVEVFHFEKSLGVFNLINQGDQPLNKETFLDNYIIRLVSVAGFNKNDPASQLTVQIVRQVSGCKSTLQRTCTLEYLPTTCKLNGLSIHGPNECVALARLEYFACHSKIDLQNFTPDCEVDWSHDIIDE